ncbi:hypothetical protein ACSQ67_003237 [Phaseolus vulgaris]
MQRARKSKTVSWSPGFHLSQVKNFTSEDCPSKIGNKSEADFQAKTVSTCPSTLEYDDVPPGFEGYHFQNQSNSAFSYIKWECPPSFVLNSCWRVAAGEQSVEKYDEMLKEMRVSEPYQPCISAIPPSPFVSFNVENECYEDSLTPLIPIEEYESVTVTGIKPDVSVTEHGDSLSKLQTQNTQQYIPPATSSEENFVAASIGAVLSAILKSIEEGIVVIDVDFLLEIANDSIMIRKIMEEYSTTTTGMSTPSRTVSARQLTPSNSLLTLTPEICEIPSISLLAYAHDNHVTATPLFPLSGPVSAHTTTMTHSVATTTAPHVHMPVKDINYYRNPVRKYGGISEPDMQNHNFQDYKRARVLNPEGVKRKIQKSCKYYKTSRGCGHGSSCRYLHDKVWRM